MNLIELLGEYKYNGENDKTHTIIPNLNSNEYKYGATYSIPQDSFKKSCKMFYEYIFTNQGKLSLTEAIPKTCPLYIDLDFDFDGSKNKRQYSDKTIDTIVKYINKNIKKHIDYENDIECYVQEKENPKKNSEGGVIKEGLHLLYPNIIGDFKVFNEFTKILSDSNISEILNSFESKPINDAKKIFDTNVKRWFIYGSSKPDGEPYKVKKIYINDKLVDLKKTEKEYLELFYLTKKFEKNINYKNTLKQFEESLTMVKSTTNVDILDFEYDMEDLDSEDEEVYHELKDELNKNKINNLEKIVLRCLSQERCDEYDLWLKVGMALKNTNDNLFEVFNKFSKRSNLYESVDKCLLKWNSFGKCSNGLTEGSLRYWARLDNKDEYDKIKEEDMVELIDKSVREGGAHDDIAKVVHKFFKDEFVCSDIKSNNWYHFDGKWSRCQQGHLLQTNLPGKIKLIYSDSQQRFRQQQNKRLQNGEPECENIKKYEETAGKIYNKLKDVPFQKNIMEACRYKFYDDKFQEDLDSNTKLLCFDNCVFDLQENILREGRPEDKLSITTKYNLPVEPNELPMNVNELWKTIELRTGIDKKHWNKVNRPSKSFKIIYRDICDFLKKVLPDLKDIEEKPGEIRNYCIKYMACRLCGEVMNRFSIWTGSGGNGKSILIDLLRQAMGGYCMNLPVTILTQKRKSSNAACPEKARTRGARLCYMQEPDENETINAGEMKELSGGDMILARNLYQEPFEFKPQFELVLMCNDKPKIEDKTNGAWRRVSVSPFNSRFVDRQEDVDIARHIYKADKTLTEKVRGWGVVFMGLLLNQWSSFDCLNISVPKSIRMETQNYKNQNDYIGQWISEQTEPSPKETLPFKELTGYYEQWLNDVYGKNIRVDVPAFKERLVKWQRDKFGFNNKINGTTTNPKINMDVREEQDE
jgi:P4 family phage/plasmid primase-like protien